MENWFLVLLPLGLLFVVSSLCFVGCVLDATGLPPDFTTYSASDIIPNPDCVAYWRLDDEGTTAVDSKGANDGQYVDNNTASAQNQFPSPSYTVGGRRSAAAAGTLKLAQSGSGIVNGDSEDGGAAAPCMQTDGAYVLIQPNIVTTPADAFSAEVWIMPGWSASDSDAFHTFLDFRSVDAAGAVSGFAMYVDGQGQLRGAVGRGAAGQLEITGGNVQGICHVVLTFANGTASLFLNGGNTASGPLNPGESYVPNTTGQQAIGAGAPWATPRTDQTADLFFPAFPFNGSIQDVAIYKKALDPITIANHHTNGSGSKTS